MDTIYKTFRAELKGTEDEGVLDMFIPVSSASVDRDGEVIEPSAFKKTIPKFMKHPVLVASHDYRDLTNQIGEWKKVKAEDNGISGKPQYYINAGNEQADWAYYLASKGVAAFSIGFIPKEWEDGDGQKTPRRTYKDIELLEISQVIIPSNREAIQSVRSKSVDPVVLEICDAVEKEIVTKPEETEEYIRIPVDTADHSEHRIRTIVISDKEGIKALYCGTCKKVITYLFSKDKGWNLEKARSWVKEHEKKVLDIDHKISQAEIIDEIDYLRYLIANEGLNEHAKLATWDLVKEILRLSGSDIPVEIKALLAPVPGVQGVKSSSEKTGTEIFTNQDISEAIKRIAKTNLEGK